MNVWTVSNNNHTYLFTHVHHTPSALQGLKNRKGNFNFCIKYILTVTYNTKEQFILFGYRKTCVKLPLSKRPKLVFKTNYRLMQVKNIAECSKGSILQSFSPSFNEGVDRGVPHSQFPPPFPPLPSPISPTSLPLLPHFPPPIRCFPPPR